MKMKVTVKIIGEIELDTKYAGHLEIDTENKSEEQIFIVK